MMNLDAAGSVRKKRSRFMTALIRNKWLYIMLIPGTVYYIMFKLVPFGYLVIIFQDYFPPLGIGGSPWVGFQNFIDIFNARGVYTFPQLFTNTLILAINNLVFYFPVPFILALLLNEVFHDRYKKLVQTFVYLPHFLSWPVMIGIVYLFCSSTGVISRMLLERGGGRLEILMDPNWFRPLIIIETIWKEAGWGTIIYLAALSGVDSALYEAAVIDGAGRMRQMWHITLPGIRSTVIILLILRMGSFMDTGFEQIYLMRNSLNRSVAEVFDTYVYTRGVQQGYFSYATALGVFKSVISLILVLGANSLAKVFDEEGIY